MPFLLHAPAADAVADPPNSVGDEPKSQSCPLPAAPGTCHASSRASEPESRTIDSASLVWLPAGQVFTSGSHSLPVATHRLVPDPVAATDVHTLPPIEPSGTEYQVCSTAPVCWSISTTPPRTSGSSQKLEMPT